MNPLKSFVGKLWQRKTQMWFWSAPGRVCDLQVYYVQEMLAALFIFSVLFVIVGAVLLAVFLLDRASQRTVAGQSRRPSALLKCAPRRRVSRRDQQEAAAPPVGA